MPPKARSRPPVARAATVALPRRQRRVRGRARLLLKRLVPSRRSLGIGFGIVAIALGAYAVARETAVFAIHGIEVHGGSAAVDAQVQEALKPFVGKSLVGLDGSAVVRHVEALPSVVSATYDRSFPHTLRITVVPERPTAVLRTGSAAWLVSATGTVMRRVDPRAERRLARIWLPTGETIKPGQRLGRVQGAVAAQALGHAGALVHQVLSAAYRNGSLVFRLRSGVELRLGAASHLPVKLAVAVRTLPLLPAGSVYLDVSVPERPVSGTKVVHGTKSSSGG